MTIFLLALYIVINIIFQSTILPYLAIFGFVPNTALVLVVLISIIRGKYYGIFFALAIGLLEDVLFGATIGLNGLLYSMIGFSIGSLKNILNTDNIGVPVFFSALATIVYNFSYGILIFFLSREITFPMLMAKTFSIEIILNILTSIALYKLLFKTFKVPTLKFGNR